MADPLSTSLRVIRSLANKADDAPRAIRAYHGSPHSFSRFDASRVGTGEGVQSFGHGLYFAGNEETARSYRDKLAPRALLHRDGTPQQVPWFLPQDAIEDLARLDDWRAEWTKRIRQAEDRGLPSEYVRKELEAMNAIAAGAKVKSGGHMYEVELDVPEDALLDLDAPVRSQSRTVQDALGVFGEAPGWFSLGQEGWRGKDAYTRMAGAMAAGNPRIVGGYHVTHDMPAASNALLQAGVPGSRYLDGVSRTTGQGTHNYVMFPGTEDRIKILRQYGLLPPLMAPALMEDE